MDQGRATARWQSLAPLTLLKWTAALLLAGKLALLVASGTFMDEAYYWMWGQHPALSYYDHPPLNAWLQGLAGAVFGWNRLGLRVMVALALAGDILVLYLLAKKLAPEAWQQHFWLTLVLFLATPIFFAVTAVALPDHLLVLGMLAAFYFFVSFFRDWRDGPDTSYRDLYLGALFLGLAALAKYNAVFLALGLGLFILISPRYRSLLRKPQLYVAAAISLALQAPVLAWNLQEGWASFGFILGGRHAGLAASSVGVIGWLMGVVLFLSPFLLVPIGSFLLRPGSDAGRLGRIVFLVSTLAIFGISFATSTLFHWNLVAYLVALPFLAFHFRWRWLYWAQIAYGVLFMGFALVNYSIVPLTDVNAIRDEASAWVYGWDETAVAVEAARAANGAGFVAAPDYTTAALLGFAMQDRDVVSLSPKTDQFDFWFDPAAHAGETAILFGDDWRPLTAEVTGRFEEVVLLQEIAVVRFGKPLDTHRIYLAKGFRPNG
jgi:4-amino-4-deoxy-L-arabinose transferase-like glycosyltransferase